MNNESNDAPICSYNELENIKRCNQCYKIPLIELIKRNNKYFIKYNCENGHSDEINLEDFLKNNKNSINKIDCFDCKKKQEKENDFLNFFYCVTCKQILCDKCIINHRIEFHQSFLLSKYDSTCLEHNQSFSYYCKDCNKNICILCSKDHKIHDQISLSEILIYDKNLKEIKNKVQEIYKLKNIKDEIIEELNPNIEKDKKIIKIIEDIYSRYENNMNLLYSLYNNLEKTYIYEIQLNNYNYEIIENFKSIEKLKFPLDEPFPSFSACNNIYDKSEIFINYYKLKFSSLDNCKYITLNYHSDVVNQIILLKDGRIASSSNDKSIIIYNQEDFSVQLQIKNFDSEVLNIMQGSNDYIFASLYSGNISFFKLNPNNSHPNIQNINAHKDKVRKIIELKDGRYVSCSEDKTIKIWKFINNELILDKIIYDNNVINSFSSIEEVNENEIISTPINENGSILFWNINEGKIISQINGIACVFCWNLLKKISNNTFIVGGVREIYLIKDYKLIDRIQIELEREIYSICYLNNGNILTGHFNGFIQYWNFNNNKLEYNGKRKFHDNRIRVISQISDDLILSGSNDSKIQIIKT